MSYVNLLLLEHSVLVFCDGKGLICQDVGKDNSYYINKFLTSDEPKINVADLFTFLAVLRLFSPDP